MEGLLHWSPDSPVYNATWHVDYDEDPAELLRVRRRELVQMARYARAAVPGELLGWGDVDVREFRALYRELKEVLDDERPTTSISEG